MQSKMTFPIILFFIFQSFMVLAQENISVVKMNSIVGDTIDITEKIRYRLFQDINNENFKFAVCLMHHNNMTLRIHKPDLTFTDIPYSTERLLKDSDLVWKNQFNEYTEPKVNFKKVQIKISDRDSRKYTTLKKGKTIQLKLKNSSAIFRAKIKEIPPSHEPTVIIKQEAGNNKAIRLSDIEYIYKYKKAEYIAWKVTGALYLITGIAMIADGFYLGPYFAAAGAAPFIFWNKKLIIDNSKIQMIYK